MQETSIRIATLEALRTYPVHSHDMGQETDMDLDAAAYLAREVLDSGEALARFKG